MKLTTEQIQFIDHYLENVGVVYEDIRFEMTDHVATALERQEGDFMENFKRYMIKNKRQLLSGDKQFKKLALRRAATELGKTLCQYWVLPGILMLVFITHYFFSKTNIQEASFYMRMIFFAVYLAGSVKTYKRSKYSVISKLYGVCGIIFYYIGIILNPERLTDNTWVVFSFYSAIIIMGCALTVTSFRIYKQYKTRYAA